MCSGVVRQGKMKATWNNSWAFILFLVLAITIMCELKMALSQQVSASQCQDEIQQGMNKCMAVVMGQPPSAACCARVRVTHAECVCPLITPEIAAMVDVNRAKKMIEGCGRKIPPHFKCGSLTFP